LFSNVIMEIQDGKNKILFIEICNYIDYPIGGYMAFAKQMLTAFGNQLVLVGLSTDDTPVGVWVKKNINGVEFDFFSVMKVKKKDVKPLIPGRLHAYFCLRKYLSKILKINVHNVFVQTPEVMFALSGYKSLNICNRIPGLENPLKISRYNYSKYFVKIFDILFFNSLKRASVILASADEHAINDFVIRSKGQIELEKLIQFPTRVDTNVFYPRPLIECREILKLPLDSFIVLTTGRLNSYKGWRFMIDSFRVLMQEIPNALFVFVGDGEDRFKIQSYIESHSLSNKIILVGRKTHEELAVFLNSSNVYISGSYVEGWSTSLVEAIACGIPVVCTNFSSAKELVENHKNGYVIDSHDVIAFVKAILNSQKLSKNELLNRTHYINKYSTDNLKLSILEYWKLV